jgi:hypothetical protein
MANAATQQRSREGWPSLWFGVLTGPILYSLHFMAVYLLVETACKAGRLQFSVLGINGIAFWVVLLTLVAAGVTGYSTFVAYRDWRQTRLAGEGRHESYAALMALLGLLLSGFFTVVILLTGLPALFLVACDWI